MRLIATDLDGTFLGANSLVSPRNLQAAHRAVAAGVEFVVATGRPTRWLDPLEPLRRLSPKVIVSNGAAVLDLATSELLQAHPIDSDLLLAICQQVSAAIPSATYALEYGFGWAHEPSYGRPREGEPADAIDKVENLPLEGVLKLIIWSATIGTESLAEQVSAIVNSRMTVTFSWVSDEGMLELSAKGITKASALAEILNRLDIDSTEAVAFGDMLNDLEMLRLVGRGFVPANAHPLLRESGFAVIDHHAEDGVGNTIHQLLDEANL